MHHLRKLSGVVSSPRTARSSDVSKSKKVHAGYLFKQGFRFSKKFRKRWFILYEGKILKYYVSDIALSEAKGEINLSQITSVEKASVMVVDTVTYRYTFNVVTNDRTYLLAAPDQKQMNIWMDLLRSTVFGQTIHSGWLSRKLDSGKSWKRRYYVLNTTRMLRGFADDNQTVLLESLDVKDLIDMKEGEAEEPAFKFVIELTALGKSLLLNAETDAERKQWLSALSQGKNANNYEADASLFVDIQRKSDKKGVDCKTSQRIKYVLNLYEKWCRDNDMLEVKKDKLLEVKMDDEAPANDSNAAPAQSPGNVHAKKGIWEIINGGDLQDYNSTQLLNDVDFVLHTYGSTREQFVEFYKYIVDATQQDDIYQPKVAPQASLILLRNLRDRTFYARNGMQRQALFNDEENQKEINQQCALDRFYAFVMYSYQTLLLNPIEWQRIKDYNETDKLITAKAMLTDKRLWIKSAKAAAAAAPVQINQRRQRFMLNVSQQMSTASASASAVEENKETDDNGVDVVAATDTNRVDVALQTDAKTAEEYFQFGGAEFSYWDSDKGKEYHIESAHETLKEEMLNNSLCQLSAQQWDELYIAASSISETDKASSYSSYDALPDDADVAALVEKYGIFEYTPMKMDHICSLLVYCNNHGMQQMLSSTYAARSNESVSDWKLRHAQLANLARLIRESCQVFGKLVSETDRFYYSINDDKLDFGKSLKSSYAVPVSMTKDLFVAHAYFEFNTDDNAGMMLSVTQQSQRTAFYIDCAWCSDFPHEQEVLVFAPFPHLARIQSMIAMTLHNDKFTCTNYQFYMSAMADLDRMVHAQHASDTIDKWSKRALRELIQYKCGDVNDTQQDAEEEPARERLVTVTSASASKHSAQTSSFTIQISDALPQSTQPVPLALPQSIQAEQKEVTDTEADDNDEADTATGATKVRPKGVLLANKHRRGSGSDSKQDDEDDGALVFRLRAKRARKVPEKMQKMFDDYCQSVKRIRLTYAQMVQGTANGGFAMWKDVFVDAESKWIRLDILVRLFVNLQEIRVFYTKATFSKKTVKALIAFLNNACMLNREITVLVYKPDDPHSDDEDSKQMSLQTALKYLSKKSKVGENFQWFVRKNFDAELQSARLEIIRPHLATERNQGLSAILSAHQIDVLMQLLRAELAKNNTISNTWYLKLLYRASKDGFEASAFHELCDNVGHTISIIQSSRQYVFGAYVSTPWKKTGKFGEDKYSFVVAIQSQDETMQPRVINLKPGHEAHGIYFQSNGGPGFGKGDIKILNKADQSSRNTCNSNSFAFNMNPNELVGGKGSYFKVSNYEVFQVAFY